MEENLCEGCTKCCDYVALEIDKPKTKEDFDEIRWFLLHKDVLVFIDHDKTWNLQFDTPCTKMKSDGWCGYYEKRPTICKKHSTDNCEKFGAGNSYKVKWKNIEEFEEWMKENKPNL